MLRARSTLLDGGTAAKQQLLRAKRQAAITLLRVYAGLHNRWSVLLKSEGFIGRGRSVQQKKDFRFSVERATRLADYVIKRPLARRFATDSPQSSPSGTSTEVRRIFY